jgi:hypothetical protein
VSGDSATLWFLKLVLRKSFFTACRVHKRRKQHFRRRRKTRLFEYSVGAQCDLHYTVRNPAADAPLRLVLYGGEHDFQSVNANLRWLVKFLPYLRSADQEKQAEINHPSANESLDKTLDLRLYFAL